MRRFDQIRVGRRTKGHLAAMPCWVALSVALGVCFVAATSPTSVASQAVVIDVASEFGATFDGVAKAMDKAVGVLASGRSATVFFATGNFNIDM
jgi:hypothetical protein